MSLKFVFNVLNVQIWKNIFDSVYGPLNYCIIKIMRSAVKSIYYSQLHKRAELS